MKLTDVALQKLRPNSRNDFIVQGRTGLIVRAAPSNGGTKIQFRYRWKKEGKTSVVTLGDYPDLSIKDANALHGLCAQASGQPYGEPRAVVEEWHRKRAPAAQLVILILRFIEKPGVTPASHSEKTHDEIGLED